MGNLRWAREHTLLSSVERTTDGYSNVINAGEYGSAIFFLDLTAISVGGALTGLMQMSPDNVSWYDTDYKFADAGAVSKQILVVPAVGKYVRLSYGITGTITFGVVGAFKS